MKELTIEEISELFIISGGSEAFMKKLNDRMNEPEPVSINYKARVYPKNGTDYWCIDRRQVGSCTWANDGIDKARFNTGNYYATQQEADLEFEWRLLNTQILNTIAMLNKEENWVVDWENLKQGKCYLTWNSGNNMVTFAGDYDYRYYENNRYTSTLGIGKLRELYTEGEFKFWITKEKI